MLGRAFLAVCAGFAGGALFAALHLPLPWMLGSLSAAALIAILRLDWRLPIQVRSAARPVIGVMAGGAFTPAVIASIKGWWPVLPCLLLFFAICGLLGWFYFTRICRMDNTTAALASAPGGLSELTLLGGDLGGNVRTLVLVHSVRVVLMVFMLPFIARLLGPSSAVSSSQPLAAAGAMSPGDWVLLIACGVVGYFLGRPVRRRGGVLLVPLGLSIAVHSLGLTEANPPAWLMIAVQVAVGSITGARFGGITGREFRSTAIQSLAWAIIMLITAMLMAKFAGLFVDMPYTALMLAFSPGGFAEMTLVSYAIGVEVAFVVACHVFRNVSVILLAALLAWKIGKRAPPSASGPI